MVELSSGVQEELGTHATAQKQTTRVSVVTLLLTVAVLLLALPQVKEMVAGRPIHYLTDHGPGIAEPGVVPEGMARDFAQRWIEMRHTYTPETHKTKTDQLRRWLHPKIRLAFTKQTEEELREVRKRQQSSQVAIAEEGVRLTSRHGNLLVLELVGIRTVFIGGVGRHETMWTTMTLMPYFPEGYEGRLVVMQEQTKFDEAKR